MITHAELKRLLDYELDTGLFRWRVARHNVQTMPGSVAGHRRVKARKPYVLIGIDGREYKAHRLAWFWMTAAWPEHQVDHIDGDGLNNRWANLRAATPTENSRNRRRDKDNTSGERGVVFQRGKYQAAVWMGHKRAFYQSFDDYDDAVAGVREARLRLHGEFATDGRLPSV